MSIQLIWKRSSQRLSMAMSLLRPFALPQSKFPTFCTQIETPSTTSPDRVAAKDFLINKCGLTNEEITKSFRHRKSLPKSTQNFEGVLELLDGCGFTTPAQIRKVVLRSPKILFCSAERNLKSKLTLLRTVMKKEYIYKLINTDSRIFYYNEVRFKSVISLLQRLGFEGQELSELLVTQSRLVWTSEEKIIESFKQAENLGFKRGSKRFAHFMRTNLGVRKEDFDRRLRCLSSLGFSENQVSKLVRWQPSILALSEQNLKLKVNFLVKSARLPLAELVNRTRLLGCSLETRIIPRFRVMEALKCMQEKVLKKESSFASIVLLKEECFLDKYVNSNAKSSVLRDIYNSAKLESDKDTCSKYVYAKNIQERCKSLLAD